MTYENPLKNILNKLIKAHMKKTGMTQKEIAQAIGFENPNNLSMILSSNYPTNLSANRFARVQEVLALTDEETLSLFHAKAGLGEAGSCKKSFGTPMDSETMMYMLKLNSSAATAAGTKGGPL